MKDYYRILQIPRSASGSEIHDAYRRRARATHPDISGASQAGAFCDVQEAWETLGQAARRHQYDSALSRAEHQVRRGEPVCAPVQDGDKAVVQSFDSLITKVRVGTLFPNENTNPLALDVLLDAEEAERGVSIPLRIPVDTSCLWCGGNGRDFLHLCSACQGRGFQRRHASLQLNVPPGFVGTEVWEIPLAALGDVLLVRARTRT